VRKDHTRFWTTVTITALKDQDGNLLGFANLTRDDTERRMNEAALQAREAKYRALYENSHDAILLTNPGYGTILTANPAACKLFGYSEQELISLRRGKLLDMSDSGMAAAFAQRAETGEGAAELTFIRKGGERFVARVASKLFTDENGQQMSCTTIQDITARKKAEEALRRSEARFRSLVEYAPLGIVQTDRNGSALSANRKFAEISGYAQNEITGFVHLETALPEDRAFVMELSRKFSAGETETTNYERRMRRKNGATIWVRVNAKLLPDEPGKPREGMVLYEDITERKQAEEALCKSEERSRLLYENAPVGIIQIDRNGEVVYANRKFAEISGYSPEEAVGLTSADVSLLEERERNKQLKELLFAGKIEPINIERRLLRKDKSVIWVRQTATIMHDAQGRPQWGIVILEDVTEKKQAEEALQQSEEKFRATFEQAPLGIAECSIEGRFVEANSKLVEILGYSKDEITHLTIRDVTHPSDLERSLANLQKLVVGKTDSYVMEKRYIRKDRSFVWVNVTASLAPIHGKPQHLVVTVEDISARKKAEEDLKQAMESSYHQANHDMLTGLANRASFNDRLREAVAYAKRDGHLVAIHLLDLGRFKFINDTLGHHVGDLLLKDVAKRIRSHVRATDLAARFGGDEFVVIHTHLTNPAAAGVLAEKLVADLRRKYVLEDQEVQSGASLGIAVYPNDSEEPEELMRHADLALYDAKHRGRFNYQFYRKELGAAFSEAQRLERELTRALRESEFCMHYQPQFDMRSRRMTGIEALLRWHHPTRGKLAAAEFIHDAEHAKLMLSIGEWVLQTACRQHKTWIDSGLAVPLTLNFSSSQLRDPRFLPTLQRMLEEAALPPSLLQLEMRESVLCDPKLSKDLIKQVKDRGLRLALEEFGSEMTALSTLERFPLDEVKPSQGLVRQSPSRKREATILSAIIGVAHDLNIAVCADGVETANQLAAVKEQACDSVQGNLLSSPLDAEEMTRIIELELAHGLIGKIL